MNSDRLKRYQEKRDFTVTSEPNPSLLAEKKEASGGHTPSSHTQGSHTPSGHTPGGQIFVVQEHHSRQLHYDLRLEVEGVLKSWAVPKGPSMNPRDKRLAVQTEDHPVEYASFEGTIPEGQYGAGTVAIWDSGSYRNLSNKDGREIPLSRALESGHASFWLEGRRLQGGFALTRTPRGWLLVKMRDEKAES
ncbi:MAG TPA: DNA polymerase ligase N-terminal domain-containing protein [Methanothrix sp.]|jgi:DNA ligase D-like protein (predicted 3'-phosphoesterase)|uniref:DNA polymerase ligase N-terminal domain-containing protein n=1 Tax=Methanothrix sp. TaxID=90426 RepID=UPI002D0C0E99|nr:DNA polymerase ligase N-terminal domain-containing protein [Methanothrix sp.]MDI9417057.1 DNA polymerase ligase N-terminal domain-containing protein [Euryarchaeota archaeon]HON36099.1 DNA polymerase ligase N-terminal domain-containing protein [Methanothrix sp.]HRU76266.1 DNA polymerase ligase N-terminal domain-containing protein [Methanothrix sp.]